MGDQPDIRLLLADVDGTLVTQDKVLTEARRQRPMNCAGPASSLPSPAAGRRAA